MTEKPTPLPQLSKVTPYVPGEAPKGGPGKTYKLASNENPLGTSPRARAVFSDLAGRLEVYPDGGAHALKAALARKHGLDPDRIIVGAGSDEIFLMLGRAFLGPGDQTISTRHAFAIFAMIGEQQGCDVVRVPEKDFTADVDAILAAVTPRTRMVWLANPNNPTGTYLPFDEVKRLHAGLPSGVLMVLDGAYAEFVRKNDYAAGIELVSEFENVVMTRTFSKLYGLAGLRLGWAYAPSHVIDALEKVRMPFNVNLVAQAVGIAALEDEAFVRESLAHNDAELARLTTELRAMGLSVGESVGNFVVAEFPREPGKTAAEALAHMKARGVTLRGLAGYHMPDHLRISVGTLEGNDAVLAGLADFLAAR
ncbi:MAG: histidinol-phosphate transaminase [Alphaproteobacteria bacterium]|nr:histidinol-phosphate transaminase [Alphaproteobacteria bacterium]